jgi:hypothetical protein
MVAAPSGVSRQQAPATADPIVLSRSRRRENLAAMLTPAKSEFRIAAALAF